MLGSLEEEGGASSLLSCCSPWQQLPVALGSLTDSGCLRPCRPHALEDSIFGSAWAEVSQVCNSPAACPAALTQEGTDCFLRPQSLELPSS